MRILFVILPNKFQYKQKIDRSFYCVSLPWLELVPPSNAFRKLVLLKSISRSKWSLCNDYSYYRFPNCTFTQIKHVQEEL